MTTPNIEELRKLANDLDRPQIPSKVTQHGAAKALREAAAAPAPQPAQASSSVTLVRKDRYSRKQP